MPRHSIRNRRGRRKIKREFELQLTSMMDMLIILVVFLLKSYSANSTAFATSSNITVPSSTAEEAPGDAINIVVEPQAILVDGQKVLDFKLPAGMDPTKIKSDTATYEIEPFQLRDGGRSIVPVFDSLTKARENAELLMSKAVWKDPSGNVKRPKFQGTLIIHADKSVKYELLRKIMYTAGSAEYKIFKLVTIKKEAFGG